MEFRVLGPLEVREASRPLPLGSGRLLRSLLAVLLARPNQVVSTDVIVESLWPGDVPPSVTTALRVHLTRLRTRLEPDRPRGVPSTRLVKEPAGYRLSIERDEHDALRFEDLVALARRTDAHELAVSAFKQGESLWRGAAFEALDDIDTVRPEAARLQELRATALEECFEIQLRLGQHGPLVGEIQQAVEEYPLRERLAGQLMLALYRSGRQAEALRAYADLRERLGEGLGIEPDVALSELETAIIRHEDSLLEGIEDRTTVTLASLRGARDESLEAVVVAGEVLSALASAFDAKRLASPSLDGNAFAFASAVDALNCAAEVLRVEPSATVGMSAGESALTEAILLRRAAAPGSVFASELSALMAGPHSELRAEGPRRITVDGTNIAVSSLRLYERDEHDAAHRLPRALIDDDDVWFVGRDAELDRVRDLCGVVEGGRSRAVFVSGEPGIGKTRFVVEAARIAHLREWTVLFGRCDEVLRTPFQPFVGALENFVAPMPDHLLGSHLGRYAGELSRLVPELAARIPNLKPPVRSDPETERYQLFQAVADWLQTIARVRPVLLVLDDLHWAAEPTTLLLRYLLRASDLGRCFILTTFRDTKPDRGDAIDEMLAELTSARSVERCVLTGLAEPALFELLVHDGGMPSDAETQKVAALIHDETDGNPFFVHELIRHLDESGAFPLTVEVPPTVRDVVARRLTRLPSDVAELLTAVAVIGRHFDVALASAVTNMDEDTVLYLLDIAREARLVQETGFDEYRFAHALVQSALYQPLTETRRLRLHRRIGTALEQLAPSRRQARLPELADHFLRAAPAGVVDKAVRYAIEAADAALATLAFEDAANLCRRASDAVDAARRRGETIDATLECDLVLRLGTAELRAGRAGAKGTLLRAFTMSRDLDDAERMAAAVLAMNRGFFSQVGRTDRNIVTALEGAIAAQPATDSATRARLLAALASEIIWSPDGDRRFEMSDDALAMARRIGDRRTVANVLLLRSMTIRTPDTLSQRLVERDELLATAEVLNDPALEFYVAFQGSGTAMEAGRADDASAMVDRAAELARRLNQPSLLFHTSMMKTSLSIFEGSLERAEEGAYTTLELGKRANLHGEAAIFFSELSLEIARWRGRLGEMISDFAELAGVPAVDLSYPLTRYLYDAGEHERALERYHEIMQAQTIPPRRDLLAGATLCNLAYLAARAGDVANAERLYDALAPYAGLFAATTVAKPVNEHYLGLLAATMGDEAIAEQHFATAASIHEKVGAPLLVGESQLEWARVLARTGSSPTLLAELVDAVRSAATSCSAPFFAYALRDLSTRSHGVHEASIPSPKALELGQAGAQPPQGRSAD